MNFDTNGFDTEEIEATSRRKEQEAKKQTVKAVKTAQKPSGASADKKRTSAQASKTYTSKRSHDGGKQKKYSASADPDSVLNISLAYILTFLAIFTMFCTFSQGGAVFGKLVRFFDFGLFGNVAYALPFVFAFQGVTWRNNIRKQAGVRRAVSTLALFTIASALLYAFDPVFEYTSPQHLTDVFKLFFSWSDPKGISCGGGLIGSTIGFVLEKLFGTVGLVLIAILVVLLYFVIYFDFNPAVFAKKMSAKIKEKYQQQRGLRAAKAEERKAMLAESALLVSGEDDEDPTPLLPRSHRKQRGSGSQSELESPSFPAPVPFGSIGAPALPTQDDTNAKRSKISDALDYNDDEEDVFDTSDGKLNADSKLRSLDGVSSSKITGSSQDRSGYDSYGDDDTTFKKAQKAVTEDEEGDDIPQQSYDDLQKMIKIESTPDKSKLNATKSKTLALDDDDEDETIAISNKKPVAIAKKVTARVEKTPEYKFPPLSLLRDIKIESSGAIPLAQDPVAIKLHQTLATFNVKTAVTNVARGPRITRYELVPESGIRIKSIANLVDDISLALATAGIRIEAPIPGKAAVGVEVPNARSQTVGLRALLDNDEFKNAPAKTTICLGADISGEPVYADLAKMPHLLIAGATGMGKSVCINSVITSILYKAHPNDVKLILVDPKKVELSVYSGIPHLLIPVVSDPAQAAGALSWAVSEMENRFDKLEEKGVRNIKGYNASLLPGEAPMSQIVIIIDELADLMMSSPDSVETSICRIAQKARAAGIHLIIGTQRPSVDVITGLIKANIPSRIAFHVSSQVDSRTILDVGGAEKLLNNGDMLFSFAGVMKPKRVQGAFLDDDEVAAVTKFLRENTSGASYDDNIVAEIQKETEKCMQSKKKGESFDDDEGGLDGILDDPKFHAAVDVAFDANKISTSLLQRKLKIGFGRASRYIDAMCEMGIVSEPDGQKPREVLMTRSEYYERENRLSQ